MKKIVSLIVLATGLVMASCNNDAGSENNTGKSNPVLDSLEHAVDEGHIAGMGKMGKLNRAQLETKRLIDSIAALPAGARQAATVYRQQLDSVLQKLDYADFAMNKWMNEYNMDSAKDDQQKRILYLENEKTKVDHLKEAIFTSIQQAETLLKKPL